MMNIRLFCVASLLAAWLPGLAYAQAPADVAEQISKTAAPAPPTPDAPGSVADGVPPPGTVPAIWVTREVSFIYFSTTSLYYCDGLRDKVKWVMKQLGLMDGYKVRIRSCFNTGGPEMSLRARRPEFYSGGAEPAGGDRGRRSAARHLGTARRSSTSARASASCSLACAVNPRWSTTRRRSSRRASAA